MTKDKVIHIRIDNDLHMKIFEKCNELGCTFSNFIIDSLMNNLEKEDSLDQIQQIESKPITRPEVKLDNDTDNKGIQVRLIEKIEPKVTVTRVE
jgi:hypothetical protein